MAGNRTLVFGSGLGAVTVAPQALPVPAGPPVEQFLAHCWVFPASIVFSMVAFASGVPVALLFSPFSVLIVGLSPSRAIGTGLLTEVFGMGNGLLNYVRQRVVDYATARPVFTTPAGSRPESAWRPPAGSSRG
ncbi:MAG: hypothetical protein V5A62_16210 [Haloarculaceae archaeon]